MTESFFGIVFDLLEAGDDLLLEVAVPGVLETDIDVTLEGIRLVIRAERPPASGHFLHSELKRGVLIRDISLPFAVDLLESRFEDGVLRLHLKRMEAR
jgi:HSP20 family molecular chaperone IbpA